MDEWVHVLLGGWVINDIRVWVGIIKLNCKILKVVLEVSRLRGFHRARREAAVCHHMGLAGVQMTTLT